MGDEVEMVVALCLGLLALFWFFLALVMAISFLIQVLIGNDLETVAVSFMKMVAWGLVAKVLWDFMKACTETLESMERGEKRG